jgi:hypothetical protein
MTSRKADVHRSEDYILERKVMELREQLQAAERALMRRGHQPSPDARTRPSERLAPLHEQPANHGRRNSVERYGGPQQQLRAAQRVQTLDRTKAAVDIIQGLIATRKQRRMSPPAGGGSLRPEPAPVLVLPAAATPDPASSTSVDVDWHDNAVAAVREKQRRRLEADNFSGVPHPLGTAGGASQRLQAYIDTAPETRSRMTRERDLVPSPARNATEVSALQRRHPAESQVGPQSNGTVTVPRAKRGMQKPEELAVITRVASKARGLGLDDARAVTTAVQAYLRWQLSMRISDALIPCLREAVVAHAARVHPVAFDHVQGIECVSHASLAYGLARLRAVRQYGLPVEDRLRVVQAFVAMRLAVREFQCRGVERQRRIHAFLQSMQNDL